MTKRRRKVGKGPITAGELQAILRGDPEFRRMIEERQRRHQEAVAPSLRVQKEILRDLRKSVGVKAQSLADLPGVTEISPEIVQVLLRWLPIVERPNEKAAIVRTLGAARQPFDGRPLADLFEQTDNQMLRSAIANAIACARPTGVSEWILGALKNREFGDARAFLCEAVARLTDRDVANRALLEVFEEMPGYSAMGLAISGSKREMAFLASRRHSHEPWIRKEIRMAIRKIGKRLAAEATSERGEKRR
jgi:hypothetical protein